MNIEMCETTKQLTVELSEQGKLWMARVKNHVRPGAYCRRLISSVNADEMLRRNT